ncbi:MAG TPA: LysM peptidoglycan-binding domain-containing protein [Arthrobacter sp.]
MSAISASQDSRPQLVSVQDLTSRQWSVPVSSPGSVPRARRDSLPPLRLTRRGRIVVIGIPLVILAAIVLSLAGFLTAPAKAAESATDLSVTHTVSVTVQAGQSLWAIAGSVAPDRDPRDVIADIAQLNNLSAAGVVPGQQLFVPVK